MNIIFDLDGTLIDSSEGILKSIQVAFDECKIEPKQPLTAKLIGPPLNKLLPLLIGHDKPELIDEISHIFKEKYDNEGFKVVNIFEDIEILLKTLFEQGHTLYIATNKRINPTEKIIPFLGWSRYFESIYALDSFPNLESKKDLIGQMINMHSMNRTQTVYIGDTIADYEASKYNNINYIMVAWGYDSKEWKGDFLADSPLAIVDYIFRIFTTGVDT